MIILMTCALEINLLKRGSFEVQNTPVCHDPYSRELGYIRNENTINDLNLLNQKNTVVNVRYFSKKYITF
jgi:hypothetical protein